MWNNYQNQNITRAPRIEFSFKLVEIGWKRNVGET